MNRNELLEYLRALSSVENAAYACTQAMNSLKQQMDSGFIYTQAGLESEYPGKAPKIPEKPQHHLKKKLYFVNDHFSFSIGGTVIGVLVGIFILGELLPSTVTENYYLLKLFVFGAIGSVVPYLFRRIISSVSESSSLKEFEKEEERIAEEYQILVEEYRKKKLRYEKRKERWLDNHNLLKEKIRESFQKAINDDEKLLRKINTQRKQLYDMNIVYDRFQNMVAVNTLLEYIEMGVCDSLEGPNGAYAMYLQDLRMQNICGSISELKDAMTQALKQITLNQERLIHEVREIDTSINDMNRNLGNRLEEIRAQTNNVQTAIIEKQKIDNENIQDLAKQMADVGSLIRDAAYNEYIQMRIETTNRYLRTHLRNPNLS